jgi:flagellar basal body-associated protein FliL
MADYTEGGLGFPSLLGPTVFGGCEGSLWTATLYGLVIVAFVIVLYFIWKGKKEKFDSVGMSLARLEHENSTGQPESMYDPIETEVQSGTPYETYTGSGSVGPKMVNNQVGPGDLQRILY